MNLTPTHWLLGCLAAFLIGMAKTGVPGVGILSIPMLAATFGGRTSLGILLPLLILGDCMAVAWYRQHTRWERLVRLIPWVLVGLAIGTFVLWRLGEYNTHRDYINTIIGSLVLVMLAFNFMLRWWGDLAIFHSPWGVASLGSAAGFSTVLSNAAGPFMIVYFTSLRLPKEQLIGTSAWYYLIFNLGKLPIYAWLTYLNPAKPIITVGSLLFSFALFPAILLGAISGRHILKRIPQSIFDTLILILAGAASVHLIRG